MATCGSHLYVKVAIASSIIAGEDTCRVGTSVDFWGFSFETVFSRAEKFPLEASHNRAKSGIHPKNRSIVTASKRMFTILLHMRRRAQSPLSISKKVLFQMLGKDNKK